MNKVVDLDNWKASKEEEVQTLHVPESKANLTQVFYMYGDDADDLCGVLSMIDHQELTSIEYLRQEIRDQQQVLNTGVDKHGNDTVDDKIEPWEEDGFIVCREGVFSWNWATNDYEFVGKIRRTERIRVVDIWKDSQIIWEGTSLSLKRGSSYQIVDQYVAYVDEITPTIMLVIKADGSVPIAIPFDKEFMSIQYQDYAVIAGG